MSLSRRKETFGFRAVMLDLGRVTERKEYYTSLLPWLAEWGYNVVHLHLADDQRCALRFPSRPELATADAYTPEEMREFIRAARSHGLKVMPEIECLGHTRFITDHPRYRHLVEPGLGKSGFNAICPSHSETRAILSDLLRDTAEIFDYPVIHVGLDEVKFGGCPRCRKKFGKDAPEWKRFTAHSAWVHEEVRRVGRRPAMWADHVVKSGEIRQACGKDVLMFHWDYNPGFPIHKADRLLGDGFEVVCCPATVCWLTRVAVGDADLANLRQTTARSAVPHRKGLKGLDNTLWCPWRYLPGAIDFGMAFAGHLMKEAGEDAGFSVRFAKSFYGTAGADAASSIGAALFELARHAFDHNSTERIVSGVDSLPAPFSAEDRRQCTLAVPRVAGVLAALKKARPSVRKNRDRYEDVILTAETLLAVARFGAACRRKGAVPGGASLLARALKAWNRDRHPEDTNKFGDPRHHGNDGLLAILKKLTE